MTGAHARRIALTALGLGAVYPPARAELVERGYSPLENGMGVALPRSGRVFDAVFASPVRVSAEGGPSQMTKECAENVSFILDVSSSEPILEALGKMCMPVSATKARDTLATLRDTQPELFSRPDVLLDVGRQYRVVNLTRAQCWDFLDSSNAKLHVRRATQDLFAAVRKGAKFF